MITRHLYVFRERAQLTTVGFQNSTFTIIQSEWIFIKLRVGQIAYEDSIKIDDVPRGHLIKPDARQDRPLSRSQSFSQNRDRRPDGKTYHKHYFQLSLFTFLFITEKNRPTEKQIFDRREWVNIGQTISLKVTCT